MAPSPLGDVATHLEHIMDLARPLRAVPGLTSLADEIQRTCLAAMDAVIWEVSAKERRIADLEDRLARRRRKLPIWRRLGELPNKSNGNDRR